jgi:hypothetical protein
VTNIPRSKNNLDVSEESKKNERKYRKQGQEKDENK